MSEHAELSRVLASLGEVEIRGVRYSGVELASMVSINPANLHLEATKNPEVIFTLGRLAAAAYRRREEAELDLRLWLNEAVTVVCSDPDAAFAEGLADSGKTPSKTAAESWAHSLPEYETLKRLVIEAEEAWSTVHAAFRAAEARKDSFRELANAGPAVDGEMVDRGRMVEPTVDQAVAKGEARRAVGLPPFLRNKK